MHPMRHLLRTKGLLAQVGEKSREACGVEIEQVDHGQNSAVEDRQCREEIADFRTRRLRAVGSVDRVGID